ncbi:MAG: hypothetical protein MUF79_10635 [Burkholderiales bacterium]|jgi:hypothetical protein|nr:hypothetical protein [Burkholderiales bacterium]
MLEWLCLIAVMAFIATKLQPRDFERARNQWGFRLPGAAAAGSDASAAPPRVVPKLMIAGTERPALGSNGFVKGFGIDPTALKDLSVYRRGGAERFPVSMAAILSDLYDGGHAVGDAIMELIHHGRPLAADEGVYFALVQAHENAEPRVVAFVDRLRAR